MPATPLQPFPSIFVFLSDQDGGCDYAYDLKWNFAPFLMELKKFANVTGLWWTLVWYDFNVSVSTVDIIDAIFGQFFFAGREYLNVGAVSWLLCHLKGMEIDEDSIYPDPKGPNAEKAKLGPPDRWLYCPPVGSVSCFDNETKQWPTTWLHRDSTFGEPWNWYCWFLLRKEKRVDFYQLWLREKKLVKSLATSPLRAKSRLRLSPPEPTSEAAPRWLPSDFLFQPWPVYPWQMLLTR